MKIHSLNWQETSVEYYDPSKVERVTYFLLCGFLYPNLSSMESVAYNRSLAMITVKYKSRINKDLDI